MVTIKPSTSLHAEVTAQESGPGVVTARETRDGVAWLVVEFPGYGTVILPAADFDEV
jgi:hypothetical protein